MILIYTKIINSVVLELKTQTMVGVVSDIVIKKSGLSIYGLLLKRSWINLLIPPKVISSLDIAEIGKSTVIINDAESVSNLSEAIRIKEAVKCSCTGIGQLVVTKSGRRLGRVFDYMVESSTLKITGFYVKKYFSERIISANSVIKFEGRKIIVKDDLEPIGVGAPDMETA